MPRATINNCYQKCKKTRLLWAKSSFSYKSASNWFGYWDFFYISLSLWKYLKLQKTFDKKFHSNSFPNELRILQKLTASSRSMFTAEPIFSLLRSLLCVILFTNGCPTVQRIVRAPQIHWLWWQKILGTRGGQQETC